MTTSHATPATHAVPTAHAMPLLSELDDLPVNAGTSGSRRK